MSTGQKIKDGIVITIFAVVILGFLALAFGRTADVYYKAAWIVAHFPPQGEVCAEPFCLRTDTSKPERRSWGFLDFMFAYCPEHISSGFQGRGGRSGGIVLLMGICVAILSFLSVPILGALFRIAAWPLLGPMWLAGKLSPWQLVPFAWPSDPEEPSTAWLESSGMIAGAVVALAAMFLYCWW